MIFSEEKRFVFIHIPKTGGMSIKLALKQFSLKENEIPVHHRALSTAVRKHDPAKKVRAVLNLNIWSTYYKFAFVRNPFDWMVSLYHYIKKDKRDPRHMLAQKLTFKEFALWFSKASPKRYPARKGQKSYVTNATGSIILDFVGRLENFNTDFNTICKKLNIKNMAIPRVNTTKHKSYPEYYDEEAQKCVTWMFREDLEFFNYKFNR